MQDNIKRPNIHVIGVPEIEKIIRQKKYLKRQEPSIFTKPMKDIILQGQTFQQTPSRKCTKKNKT